MITQTDIAQMMRNRSFAHIYNRGRGLPVVKIIGQTDGGFVVQQPDGSREAFPSEAEVASRVNALFSPSRPKKKAFTFKPRRLGGLHVIFTTDANQVVVVWRYRIPDTNQIGEESGTYWAVSEEGCLVGTPDLSNQQRAWLESLRPEVDAWEDFLTQNGFNQNTGGTPTPTGRRGYSVPIGSVSGRYRNVR
jgi:hypothetical protein